MNTPKEKSDILITVSCISFGHFTADYLARMERYAASVSVEESQECMDLTNAMDAIACYRFGDEWEKWKRQVVERKYTRPKVLAIRRV